MKIGVFLLFAILVFSPVLPGTSHWHTVAGNAGQTVLTSSTSNSASVNTNSTLSYRLNTHNTSLLGSNGTEGWTSLGQVLSKKVESLNIPEKAKMLPNFNIAPLKENNTYIPSYTSAPAPMGIGSYGVLNKSGTIVPYSYSTNSFHGRLAINNVSELNMGLASPTSFSIQLNAVLNNVTLFGDRSYQYWTQNVVSYTVATHNLTFVDNIWNFTSPTAVINGNEFHSSNGTAVPNALYYAIGPSLTIYFPFILNLYLNTTSINGYNTVFFNYSISNPSGNISGSYDEVQFNSTSPNGVSSILPASFQVSGNTLTGTGFIPMDAEFVIGGPGGGSTAIFHGINATMGLSYLNGNNVYTKVESAYNVGSETGETSTGISEYYAGYRAYLDSGPSFVSPLWGISNNPGFHSVSGSVNPSNAFVFMSNGTSIDNLTAQWAPSGQNGKFDYKLPPGRYSMEIMISYHSPQHFNIDLSSGNVTLGSISLARNLSAGLYTPLYALNNGQLQNMSVSGSGTVASPYLIPGPGYYGSQGISVHDTLSPVFAQANDYLFPTFSGILVSGTTDYAVFDGFQTPSGNPVFGVQYPPSLLPFLTYTLQVPSGNHLNMVFYNSSHIILNNSVISSWFPSYVYYGADLSNVPVVASLMLWNSTSSLVEHNTIESYGSGVLIYGTGNLYLNNTIWNNTFENAKSIPTGSFYGSSPIGLTIVGSGNMVYNNIFNTTIPVDSIAGAYSDLFNETGVTFMNHYNTTKQPSGDVAIFDGVPLSGNILGLGYQSGNFYYDYFGNGSQPYNGTGVGFAFNGQGVLNGSISNGYDYAPLVLYGYETSVYASYLPQSQATYYDLNNAIYRIAPGGASTIYIPNGTYDFQGFILYDSLVEYIAQPVLGNTTLTGGFFVVSGPLMNLYLDYTTYYNVTISETGLPIDTIWGFSVPLAGIGYTLTNDSQSLFLNSGAYSIFPQSVDGYYAVSLQVAVNSPLNLVIQYSSVSASTVSVNHTVRFTEYGLPNGTTWGIVLKGQSFMSANSTIALAGLPAGTYQYSVVALSGYESPAGGSFVIASGNSTVSLTFVKNQGTPYYMLYLGIGIIAGIAAGGAAVFLRMRKT